ncbi:uncharacterized protein ALTATR162_LOCUS8673 [Alternaria atra]|uniref:Uncharacterized protein n=1 Tax=Alternaria atra TaxID=119953 RepID=A0A8J2N4Q2_9PLEO|nr:uncharacterized protein ALTATR162_LOCUS8673 [Alternaria atra]CAG5178383.1 unnamed protein product [Alternaria atra]
MSPTNGSLTLFDDPFDNDQAKQRNHLSGDKLYESRHTNPISPTTIPSSISRTNTRPVQASQSLGQLAGYATSEEDEPEEVLIQGAKKGRPKWTIVYKSAELVTSDSSEFETSTSLKHHKRAVGTVPHPASRSKLDDRTRKMRNMSTKKSPTSALASSSIAKRPNTKGGFVVDSESDIGGSDHSDEDDYGGQSRSTVRRSTHASESPSFYQASLKTELSATALPTKQLNKSRLNKLFGRAKTVITTPKQERLLAHTQRSVTTAPTPSSNSLSTASLGPQQTSHLQSAGSRHADRAKHPNTASTAKEVKVLSQQTNFMDLSMTKIDGKASSISREIQQPTIDSTKQGRMLIQTDSVSTPPTTVAAGSSSSPLLQQRKPVLGVSIARGRKNSKSSDKASSATQLRSLLQLTLDEAKNDSIRNTRGAQLQVSGQEEPNIAKRAPTLASSIRKSESIHQPCVKERETTAADAASKKHSSLVIQSPKASRLGTPQRTQHHTQAPDPGPGKSTPVAPKANAASTKSTPSISKPSAQKRKLDSMSGGPDNVSTTAPKRPAPSPATALKRLETTQAVSKVKTNPYSVTASEAVVRKLSTVNNKTSASVTTALNTGTTLSSGRPVSEYKPASILPSLAINALVGRQGSSVATSSNLGATPVVSHLPAHARKAAIDQPVEKSRTPKATLLSQTEPVDRPEGFAASLTKLNSSRSPESTENTSTGHDSATFAQHNDSSSGVVATSSLDLNVSSEWPTANKSDATVLGIPSKRNTRRVAVTPYPEKALSLSVTTCPEELRQIAESNLAVQRQHGSTSTISFAKVPPVATADSILPTTGKEPASISSMTVPMPSSINESQVTNLAESATLETSLHVSTDSIENAALRSEDTPTDNKEMDVDSVHTITISIQRDDSNADAVSVSKAFDGHGSSHQSDTIVETKNVSLLTSLEPASPKQMIIDAPKIALTPPLPHFIPGPPSLEVATTSDDVLTLSGSSKVSKGAQSYFEYSVFQKVWSSEQAEEDIAGTEIIVRPFTNIVEANGHAEKVFQGSRAHFFDAIFESSNERDEYGCSIFTGSVTPFDNPTKRFHLRIWIQRDIVSKLANQTPQTLKGTSFISSTCYVLRLFNLAEQADTEGSDSSDSDDGDAPAREPVRVYQSHTRPEVYTTLDAANRAARALQIELSHEKEPRGASKAFQEKDIRELNAKLVELQSAERNGGDGCWKSKFNACGLGADTLEVVVEKTGICGPRNI